MTPAELEARDARLAANAAAYAAKLQAECTNYGFTPGTDAFAQCMQQADLQNQRAFRERALHDERMVIDQALK